MAKTTAPDDQTARIYALEDELKAAKARIAELRDERDEANALVASWSEHHAERREIMERWKTTFGMIEKDGIWVWESDHPIIETQELVAAYIELRRSYDRLWQLYDPQDVGRPLKASEAQCAQVLKLHKEGTPVRLIVDETSLSRQTIRTIIGRDNRTDRTTMKRKRKHMPDEILDKAKQVAIKANKRAFDALPRQVAKHLAAGEELLKAAKGLGKAR
jgi:hypothetical protein